MDTDVSQDVSPTDGNNTNRASMGRTPVDTATYEFEHSMWDAALLVPWRGLVR